MLSHIGNTHTNVPTEASKYLSYHFSWLSLPLWEWGIISYYRALCDMNNVQLLPVPCIISPGIALWLLLHTLMHGKLNVLLGKGKTTPKHTDKLNELVNNSPWRRRPHRWGEVNLSRGNGIRSKEQSAVKDQCKIITAAPECLFRIHKSAPAPSFLLGRIEVSVSLSVILA